MSHEPEPNPSETSDAVYEQPPCEEEMRPIAPIVSERHAAQLKSMGWASIVILICMAGMVLVAIYAIIGRR